MATLSSANKNNSAVKRIMQEARELAQDPCTDYAAAPLEDDIFEWHCTLRGPASTDFEGGLYHFRITLPPAYPFRPPSIVMLTPSGRFETGTQICISFTNFHEESWQPAWGVRTAIIGLQGLFALKGQQAAGVGSVDYPPSERRRLAAASRHWSCPHCEQTTVEMLPDPPADGDSTAVTNTTPPPTESPLPSTPALAVNAGAPMVVEKRKEEVNEKPNTNTNETPQRGGAVEETKREYHPAVSSPRLQSSLPPLTPTTPVTPVVRTAVRPNLSAPRSRPSTLILDIALFVLFVLVLGLIFKRTM